MPAVQSLFAVPYALSKHPAPGPLNARLRELFLAREAEGDRHANPSPLVGRNDQVFESRFDLFAWPDDCVQELKKFCWRELYHTIGELNGYDLPTLTRMHIADSTWFHVTRRGGYFPAHLHPMASWSGVYCVSPGQAVPGNARSGALQFHNPNATSQMFVDTSVLHMREPHDRSSRSFQLEAGQLVLFPSWLMHEVLPYEGDGERITVAFNTWFKMT